MFEEKANLPTLFTLEEALGGERHVSLCRELTKRYESVLRATLEEAIASLSQEEPKGEWVIVLEGRHPEEIRREEIRSWEEMSLEEIARTLKVAPGTVSARLTRARRKLKLRRKLLARRNKKSKVFFFRAIAFLKQSRYTLHLCSGCSAAW